MIQISFMFELDIFVLDTNTFPFDTDTLVNPFITPEINNSKSFLSIFVLSKIVSENCNFTLPDSIVCVVNVVAVEFATCSNESIDTPLIHCKLYFLSFL